VASRNPEHLALAQRVLGIPFKRASQRAIDYLEYEELDAILKTINRTTQQGSRDYALLATMFNTGGRVQEIADLRACDLQPVKPYQVRLFGKGRKERCCPLWPQPAMVLRTFCHQRDPDLRSESRVFLNHRGQPLTRFGIRHILARCLGLAGEKAPNLIAAQLFQVIDRGGQRRLSHNAHQRTGLFLRVHLPLGALRARRAGLQTGMRRSHFRGAYVSRRRVAPMSVGLLLRSPHRLRGRCCALAGAHHRAALLRTALGSISTSVCSVVLILWQSGSLSGACTARFSNWSSSPRLTSMRRRFIVQPRSTVPETGGAKAAPAPA